MNKIRIGNDVQINFQFDVDKIDPTSVRSIEVYIVNITKYEEFKKKRDAVYRFMKSYPQSRFEQYLADSYSTHLSGYPTYFYPNQGHCIHSYMGFGVNPDWDKIRFGNCPMESFEYKAVVKYNADRGSFSVVFPAEEQRYAGVYKAVVVFKQYISGWDIDNLRVKTFDILPGGLFELSDDETSDYSNENTIININMNFDAYYYFAAPDVDIETFDVDSYEQHIVDDLSPVVDIASISGSNTCKILIAVPNGWDGARIGDYNFITEYELTDPVQRAIGESVYDVYCTKRSVLSDSKIKIKWNGQ